MLFSELHCQKGLIEKEILSNLAGDVGGGADRGGSEESRGQDDALGTRSPSLRVRFRSPKTRGSGPNIPQSLRLGDLRALSLEARASAKSRIASL